MRDHRSSGKRLQKKRSPGGCSASLPTSRISSYSILPTEPTTTSATETNVGWPKQHPTSHAAAKISLAPANECCTTCPATYRCAASSPAATSSAATAATTAVPTVAATSIDGNPASTTNLEYSLLTTVSFPNLSNKINALIDTGSSVSLIEKSKVTVDMQLSDVITMKTAGDGQGLISKYKVVQPFLLNNKQYSHEFFVVDTLKLPNVSMIMGYDLLSKLNFVVYAGESRVILDNEELPVITHCAPVHVNVIKVDNLPPTRLIAENDICLPANTALNVCLEVKKSKFQENQLLMITPEFKYLDCCPPETITKVDSDNKTYVTLYNMTRSSNFLAQGTLIAQAEPVIIPNCPVVSPIYNNTSNSNNETELFKLISDNTASDYVSGVYDIVRLYREQFVVNDEPTGFTEILPFEIQTNNASPISQRPYRVPVAYEQEVNNQLELLQRDGIISLSKSPWASPMVVVKKKDNSLRLCVDYRKLNAVTEGDSFPLPSIEELLLKVRNSKFFSTLDLRAGYHQVSVAPKDRPKTAFLIQDKLFEYNTLPFGLRNAPSHFSRLMSSILANVINTAVLVYLDDLIVLGSTVEEHTENLIKVLEILKSHNLKCSLRKCQFFQTEVEFLGHIISASGIRPMHDKVHAMRTFPRPKNNKDVSSFLGLCGYYRKFIKDFADISRPLDGLRKADQFRWDNDCQEAFDKLRNALSSDDLLAYPRFDREFIVTCDASSVAIGGVVSQIDDKGHDRPISYCSRALKGAEVNYSATDREALAIKYCLERHRYFLLGHKVRIKSDHQALRYLFFKSDLSSRHARWLDSVLEFQIEDFEYITGKSNRVADALSRAIPVVSALTRAQARAQAKRAEEVRNLPENALLTASNSVTNNNQLRTQTRDSITNNEQSENSNVNNNLESDCTTSRVRVCEKDGYPIDEMNVEWNVAQLIDSQNRDPIWGKVKKSLTDNAFPFPVEVTIPKERFFIEDQILYVMPGNRDKTNIRTVLTKEFAKLALELVHCSPISGHLGLANTLKRAKSNFYWHCMDNDVKHFVRNCPLCIKFKGHRIVVPPARQWPIAQEKFYRIHLDLIGPLPLSACGNRWIFVATDALTRYTFTDAMENKTALTVAKSFVKFINTFGCPKELISDQGREFVNQILSEVNRLYGINHNVVNAYRPSANGLVESKNKQIISILRMLVADAPETWPNRLQIATTALNTAYNRAVGDNPFFLVYAKDIRYPFDTFLNEKRKPFYNAESYRDYLVEANHRVFKLVKYMLSRSITENRETYNIRFRTRESPVHIGARVYVKRQQPSSKLDSKFVGPYRIVDKKADSVKIKNLHNGKVSSVHMSHIVIFLNFFIPVGFFS